MNFNLRHAGAVAAALLPLLASSPAAAFCNNTSTPFDGAWAIATTYGGTDTQNYGVKKHAYQFTPLVDMKMCSIGYESPPNAPATYRFKIRELPPGTASQTWTIPASAFPNGTTTFVALPTTFPLLHGHKYELRRTVISYGSPVQLQGRTLDQMTGHFGLMAPSIQLLGTHLWGVGGPPSSSNAYLPDINFGTSP